jgi:hypothetical protein
MTATATDIALKPLVIVSLLADAPAKNAATRIFRGKPALAHTIERIRGAYSKPDVSILVWEDQIDVLRKAVPAETSSIRSCGPRRLTAQMNTVNASLRWADGWRGGLMGVSCFDRGFDANGVLTALETLECNAAILIDPNAALIDSDAIDAMILHVSERPTLEYAFLPGTPGSGAMLVRIDTLRELLRVSRLPGNLLGYHPDRPVHDPLSKEFAVSTTPRVARSLTWIMVDSDRQARRLSLLQADDLDADGLVEQIQRDASLDAMPREVVIELNTERATTPAFSILSKAQISRPPMSLDLAKRLFAQLGKTDDIRITFAGVGDPLLHDQFDQIIAAARGAGIRAIHVETDLLPARPEYINLLASGVIDVVSIHLPALHRHTYQKLMGVDRIQAVLDQIKALVTARARVGSGLPIVAPLFTKCESNLGEMEEWYDQWIRAVGAAVIRGPSDFGGEIPYLGVSDMLPPVRKPCRRLRNRMTILSDGTIASCEEDVHGRQAAGHVDRDSIDTAWIDGMQSLRMNIGCGVVCSTCKMWDRP